MIFVIRIGLCNENGESESFERKRDKRERLWKDSWEALLHDAYDFSAVGLNSGFAIWAVDFTLSELSLVSVLF